MIAIQQPLHECNLPQYIQNCNLLWNRVSLSPSQSRDVQMLVFVVLFLDGRFVTGLDPVIQVVTHVRLVLFVDRFDVLH